MENNEYIDGRLADAARAYRRMLAVLAALALLCALPLAWLFVRSWTADLKAGIALTAAALVAVASIAGDFWAALRHARDMRVCEIDTFGWLLELSSWYASRPDTPACAEKAELAVRASDPDMDRRAEMAGLAERLDDMTGEHYTAAWRDLSELYADHADRRDAMNRIYRAAMAAVAGNPTADGIILDVSEYGL